MRITASAPRRLALRPTPANPPAACGRAVTSPLARFSTHPARPPLRRSRPRRAPSRTTRARRSCRTLRRAPPRRKSLPLPPPGVALRAAAVSRAAVCPARPIRRSRRWAPRRRRPERCGHARRLTPAARSRLPPRLVRVHRRRRERSRRQRLRIAADRRHWTSPQQIGAGSLGSTARPRARRASATRARCAIAGDSRTTHSRSWSGRRRPLRRPRRTLSLRLTLAGRGAHRRRRSRLPRQLFRRK